MQVGLGLEKNNETTLDLISHISAASRNFLILSDMWLSSWKTQKTAYCEDSYNIKRLQTLSSRVEKVLWLRE